MDRGALRAGSLVAGGLLPEPGFLTALSELAGSESEIDALAERVADDRLDPKLWRTTLRGDLLELLRWALRRLTLDPQNGGSHEGPPSAALSLLPRYAFATHLLRRAAPLAALGLRTRCAFPDECAEEGARVVGELAPALGLETTLLVEPRPREAVSHAAPETLTVVTGRRSSVENVRRASHGRVVGCAGRCSIVVGRSPEPAAALARRLAPSSPPQSCTKVAAAFVVEAWEGAAGARSPFSPDEGSQPIGAALRRFHPSVVFAPADEGDQAPARLCGYRVLRCDAHGVPEDTSGFGADPRYGWPGDYLA